MHRNQVSFIVLSLIALTCGRARFLAAQPKQPQREKVTAERDLTIKKKVVAKNGVFRFVVCRASNLEDLAVQRRDSMAVSDAQQLLSERFSAALHAFAKKRGIVDLNGDRLTNESKAELEKCAKAMAIKSMSHKVLSGGTAAYLIAQIEHETLRKILIPRVQEVARRLRLSKADEASLMKQVIANMDAGWAGNRHDFVVKPWRDPLAKKRSDSSPCRTDM